MQRTITANGNAAKQFQSVGRLVRQQLMDNQKKDTLSIHKLTSAPPAVVRSHGFEVSGAAGVEPATQEKIKRVTAHHETTSQLLSAMDELEINLIQCGLPPIAILPVPLWTRITKEAGVYRFEHFDKNGTVPATTLGSFARLQVQIRQMSGPKLAAALWPALHDSIDAGIRVSPFFPKAPAHFQKNLLHLMGTPYPVHVAAVPEAIFVDRKEVLDAHARENMIPPPAIPPTPDDDPILYTMDTSRQFVALIDYFGNFPKEEQIVDMATAWYQEIQQSRPQ